MGTVRPQSATAYSPQPDVPVHITRSPGFTFATSFPVSTTSPTYSIPGIVPGPPSRPCAIPLATIASALFIPQARTLIKTSFGFGFGSAVSPTLIPLSPTIAAFISAPHQQHSHDFINREEKVFADLAGPCQHPHHARQRGDVNERCSIARLQ